MCHVCLPLAGFTATLWRVILRLTNGFVTRKLKTQENQQVPQAAERVSSDCPFEMTR
jgi:hypothetical protein